MKKVILGLFFSGLLFFSGNVYADGVSFFFLNGIFFISINGILTIE
ncbi:hypothetical protein JZO73_00150 [Enterococcus plantarum]|nr:hypothetical protein [Enterococcus plantarum]MBO0465940.1 hypothetical protein [Enterococcus plantarum]